MFFKKNTIITLSLFSFITVTLSCNEPSEKPSAKEQVNGEASNNTSARNSQKNIEVKNGVVEIKVESLKLHLKVPIKSYYDSKTESSLFSGSQIEVIAPYQGMVEFHANKKGYTFDKKKSTPKLNLASPHRVKNFNWGEVFEWSTPTIGTNIYSFLCLKKKDSCIIIGPYSLAGFDWKNLNFIK